MRIKNIRLSKTAAFTLLIAAAAGVAIFCAFTYFQLRQTGSAIGQTTGKFVGLAIGSADGIFNGAKEGKAAGEEAALSASDTSVDIVGSLQAVGTLEVLTADVTMKNFNKTGKSFIRLDIIGGDAVFTVDLSQAEIVVDKSGKSVSVTIPEPNLSLYIDQSSSKKLAEIQRVSFAVDSEDGVNSYLNSMAQKTDQAEEAIGNYEDLLADARGSAEEQIKMIVNTLSGGRYTAVHVQFTEGEG